MNLFDHICSRLTNIQRQPDGAIVTGCPICIRQGGDKLKSHLKVWPSGAFNCVKFNDSDKEHNRGIRAYIRADSNGGSIILDEYEIIDPDPRPDVETIYPEALLSKLIKDHFYWVNRGISDPLLRKLDGGVASAEEKSKLSGRYVIPIRNSHGKIAGWSGRLIADNSFSPRWKHLFKVSKMCWPWFMVGEQIDTLKKVILLESVGDWLTLETHGIGPSLVLFGLNLSGPMLGHLVGANPRHIIISTNNDSLDKSSKDAAGNKAALKLKHQLCNFFGADKIKIRFPQSGKDWGKASLEEIGLFKKEMEVLI